MKHWDEYLRDDEWCDRYAEHLQKRDATEAMRKLWEQQQPFNVTDYGAEAITNHYYIGETRYYHSTSNPRSSSTDAADALIRECVDAAGWWLPYLEAQR